MRAIASRIGPPDRYGSVGYSLADCFGLWLGLTAPLYMIACGEGDD